MVQLTLGYIWDIGLMVRVLPGESLFRLIEWDVVLVGRSVPI